MMSIKLKQTVLGYNKIQPDVVKKSEAKRANDDEVAKRSEIDQIKKQLKEEKMQLKRK